MNHILSSENRPILERFARSNLLVGFDYDGTLAPIVARPDLAEMRASTRQLLRALALRYPCTVISGRARADVMSRLGSLPVLHVSGNHGLEPWAEKASYAAQVHDWVVRLTRDLAELPGVVVENKVYSMAVHYRLASDKTRALHAINKAIERLPGVRPIPGKDVVSLVPRDAPGKGAALEGARRLLVCETALYVGDDDTDEDAFRSAPPARLLSVRVGPSSRSRATYALKNQREIDGLLRQLVALRPHPMNGHRPF
jgi:trehalose 6-phosphate phosphatase